MSEGNFVMVVAGIVAGVLMVQERLLAQTTQRAEYYADLLAVRAAGSEAAIKGLRTSWFGERCMRELMTLVIRRDADIWVATRRWYAGLPEGERVKVIERAEVKRHRLDSTHPPTGMRIAAIESRPEVAGRSSRVRLRRMRSMRSCGRCCVRPLRTFGAAAIG